VASQTRGDDALAEDVLDVEELVLTLLRGQAFGKLLLRDERLGRLGVDRVRRHAHELLLRIPQCGQPSTEDAPGVDVDRSIQPLRLGNGRVSVEDRKSTRLNSSHVAISYAVFCLKKKIQLQQRPPV